MKKVRFFLLLLPLVTLLPVSLQGGSRYNGVSGILYCNGERVCWHEIAHKMDDELGYPSRSAEFGSVVAIHLAFSLKYQIDETTLAILSQNGMLTYSDNYSPFGSEMFSSPQEELYANLYANVSGDISRLPLAFQDFYSKDTQYIELHACLMSADFKLCGRALHKEK